MAFVDNFESLKRMPIDYGNDDFQLQYRGIISQDMFEESMSYDVLRCDKKRIGDYFGSRHALYTGVFHLVLNVKVDAMSPFIPFAFVTNTDPLSKDKAKEIIKKKQNEIKFNFTDLLDDFYSIKGDATDTISFNTTKARNNRLYISGVKVDNEDNDTRLEEYKKKLSEFLQLDGNFIKVLSESYNSEGIAKKLYYTIISFDYDINSGRKLTHILIISEKNDESEYFIQYRVRALRDIVSLIRTRYISDISNRKLYESIKSAKAAIMSRNMSHNLGSHVMAYLKQHLSSVKEMLRSNVLSSLIEEENYVLVLLALSENDIEKAKQLIASAIAKSKSSTPEVNENPTNTQDDENSGIITEDTESEKRIDPIENVALPFLVGLGQFISYLQERQDFIATIATDFVPYFSSINFKDFIYDELNNDKRYERHPDRQNLKPDNILLGNIARSEGLGRETCPTSGRNKTTLGDIILKFRSTFTGDPVEKIAANKRRKAVEPLKYYKDQKVVDKAFLELNEMRKYDISLPGGVVGRQAIFSIFENIIRNAAKHGNWREKGQLGITIDIFAKEDIKIEKHKYYRQISQDAPYLEMPDDAKNKNHLSLGEVLERFYLNSKDADDIFIVTLTDNLTFGEDDLAKLRMAIAEQYVDRNGKMKEANKGIKEMRISASWLRSIKDERQNRPLLNGYKMDDPKMDDLKHDIKWISSGNDNVAPVLYARISKEGEEEHLQYIFCIVKPQKVAFISSQFRIIKEDFPGKKIFAKKGWKIFTPDAFIINKNKNFDYIVFDDTVEDDKDYNDVRRHSSSLFFRLTRVQNILMPIKNHITMRKKISDKQLEMALEKAYRGLGEKLASWDGSEKILIKDDRAKANYDKKVKADSVGKEMLDQMITFDEDVNAKYRYVTHLESKKEFQYYVVNSDDSNRFLFSEGITGNNSTDRLLRNETIDVDWFNRHLYVMKQKVAIFDERLFSKAFGLEETDFIIPPIDKFGKDIDSDKKIIKRMFPNNDDVIDELQNQREIEEYLNDYWGVDPRTGKDKDSVEGKSHLGATYASKGVYIFSIIRSCNKMSGGVKCFNLYGYHENPDNKEAFSKCYKYAVLSWSTKEKKLTIEPVYGKDYTILHDFSFISIHQGILDKLYEAFEIKNDEQAKENLTKEIYISFTHKTKKSIDVCDKRIIEFYIDNNESTHYFLPGMSIHSGRSKPAEHDMPQHFPFIPYSAIEHAVLDCKYSLVRLLNTARYE